MAAFILGAFPQAIKVFGMSGIPITQTFVAVLLANFLVPEIFRVAAGTAGAVELHPMPIVVNVKKRITTYHTYGLLFALAGTCLFDVVSYLMAMSRMPLRVFIVAAAPSTIAFCGMCIVAGVWHAVPTYTLHTSLATLKPSGRFVDVGNRWLSKSTVTFANVLALDVTHLERYGWLASLYTISWAVLTVLFACFLPYGFIMWDDIPNLLDMLILGILYIPALLCYVLMLPIAFRVLFMGSLSSWPRKVCGLEGTRRELLSGVFISFNISSLGFVYAFFYTSAGTYVPGWTDALG